jgi:hypothetical protein
MAAPSFSDLFAPNKDGVDQSSYVTASASPTADCILYACIMNQVATGTANEPTLSGGGVSTWTSCATVTQGQRRYTVFRALTGASPSSGAITIDCGGQTQNVCGWHVVEVAGALLTGTNGADSLGQAVVSYAAASGTAITLVLGSAWDNADSRGLAFLYKGVSSVTLTMDGSGFTQLGSTASTAFGSSTAFHGRDADALILSATASTGSGVALGFGLDIVGAADEAPAAVTFDYPRVRLNGLNRGLN